jgi:vitamin B12 transporter
MKFLALFVFLSFSLNLHAAYQLEKVIVSESHFDVVENESLANYEVIDGDVINERYNGDVLRALESISSVHVSQSGGLGQFASIFIRGNNSNRVLVLIDGVEVNDPSEGGRGFIMETLSGLDIDMIEVLKGSQSGVYGADAMSGVINIITKKTFKSKSSVLLGGGSYGKRRLNLTSAKKFANSWYKLSFDHMAQDGLSAALGGKERDHAQRDSFGIRYGKKDIELSYRYQKVLADTDREGFASNDDPNSTSELEQQTFSFRLNQKNTKYSSKLNIDFHQTDRDYTNKPDTYNSTSQKNTFTSINTKVSYAQKRKISKSYSLIFGGEADRESMSLNNVGTIFNDKIKNRKSNGVAIFNENRFKAFGLRNVAALRFDSFSTGSDAFTYKLESGKNMTSKLSLYAHLASGFKNPSLYQLYNATYGNSDLRPEKSFEQELGLKYKTKSSTWQFATFNQDIKDLITWGSKYTNTGLASFEGAELSYLKDTNLGDIRFSYQRVIAKSKNKRLNNRPENKWNFSHSINAVTTSLVYIGNRAGTINLEGYFLAGITYKKKIFEGFVALTLSNLFNRNYQEVAGYTTFGRNISMSYKKDF